MRKTGAWAIVAGLAVAGVRADEPGLIEEWISAPLPLLPRVSMDYQLMDGVLTSNEHDQAVRLWKAGAFSVSPGTAHGYAEGTQNQAGVRHSADTDAPHWSLSLKEMVRQTAIMRAGRYEQRGPAGQAMFVPAWSRGYTNEAAMLVTATVHYVDARSLNPVPPYTNAAQAAVTIQEAVDVAASNAVIWVLPGTYETDMRSHPSVGTGRVVVTKAVSIISADGPEVTIIRGATNPAVRGVILDHPHASLRGFTVRDGSSGGNGTTLQQRAGGGVLGLAFREISDCIAINNTAQPHGIGGGFAILSSHTSRVLRCQARANRAASGGGIAAFWGLQLELGPALIASNTASQYGGGLLVDNARRIHSLLVTDNQANLAGGGVTIGSFSECWNATIENNSAPSAGGAYFNGDQSSLINSIIYANVGGSVGVESGRSGNMARFSLLSGSVPASLGTTGIVAGAPGYLDPAIGDFRLTASSPAITSGTTIAWLPAMRDIDGLPRVAGSQPDLGAFSYIPMLTTLSQPSPHQPGDPLQLIVQHRVATGTLSGAIGFRLNLPAGWSILAAQAAGATAPHHTDREVLFNHAFTGQTANATIWLATSPDTNPVSLDATAIWQRHGMQEAAETTSMSLAISNGQPTQVWFVVQAIVDEQGSAEPTWQWTQPQGQVTVTVAAIAYHEIDVLRVGGVEVPAAAGRTNYTLLIGPVATDTIVRAYFRPIRTTQGVPHLWLAQYNLTNGAPDELAAQDQDGDGVATWEEYIAGTSPADLFSRFEIDIPTAMASGGDMLITWPSESGRRYSLYVCPDLVNAGWTLFADDIPATPPLNQYVAPLTEGATAVRIKVRLE